METWVEAMAGGGWGGGGAGGKRGEAMGRAVTRCVQEVWKVAGGTRSMRFLDLGQAVLVKAVLLLDFAKLVSCCKTHVQCCMQ